MVITANQISKDFIMVIYGFNLGDGHHPFLVPKTGENRSEFMGATWRMSSGDFSCSAGMVGAAFSIRKKHDPQRVMISLFFWDVKPRTLFY